MVRASSNAASLLLESQLCFALYSTMHAVGKAYADLLPDLGLTYPQYLVMLVLWERNDCGMKELGERLHLDSGTLTPLLKRMERGGLIHRTREKDDERRVTICLSPSGRALRLKADCLPGRLAARIGRSHHDIGVLRDDLMRLRASLLSDRARPETFAPPSVSPERTGPRRSQAQARLKARSAIPQSGRKQGV